MIPDLKSYDTIIASYSGGKDSLAVVLRLLDLGVKPELWHQGVDGSPEDDPLMDWNCTESYVKMTGTHLGLPILFQWREGGFLREMMRDNSPTGPVTFQQQDGSFRTLDSRDSLGTRLKFPQVSADLKVRWCSAYLKIDVASRAMNNDPRFVGKRTLFVTGERRQESSARAKYLEFESHRCHGNKRHVDHWRAVIDFSEQDVWGIIKRHGIRPHPAYYLGFGRVSCMKCIFGLPNQWATVRELDPNGFNRVANYEQQFGVTIKRGETVIQQADRGTSTIPKDDAMSDFYRHLAMGKDYPTECVTMNPWVLPSGAYQRCGGPN